MLLLSATTKCYQVLQSATNTNTTNSNTNINTTNNTNTNTNINTTNTNTNNTINYYSWKRNVHSPLMIACMKDHVDCVKILLKYYKGRKMILFDAKFKVSPVFQAAEKGHDKCLELLLGMYYIILVLLLY